MVPAPTTAALNTNIGRFPASLRVSETVVELRGKTTYHRARGYRVTRAMTDFEITRLTTPAGPPALKGDLDLYTPRRCDDALVAVEGEKWPTIVLDLRELGLPRLDGAAALIVARRRAPSRTGAGS